MPDITSFVRRLCPLLAGFCCFASAAMAQTVQLTDSAASPAAELGFASAMSGNRVVAASPGDAAQRGAVWVHHCDAGQCTPEQRITPVDLSAGDLFGHAVALSGDSLAIAAPGQQPAAVYVYVRNGSTWLQQARIVAPDGELSAGFGHALALSGDTLMIAADQANTRRGAVYVFTRNATLWTQQARLNAADGSTDDRFGSSLALSGDTLLVGAPRRAAASLGSYARGAVYVYVHVLGEWIEQAQLSAAGAGDGDSFGSALSLEGNRALIGAPLANAGIGRAYVFERSAGQWSQNALLGPSNGAPGDRFGWAVSLSADTALIGAPFARATCGDSYRFNRNGAQWNAAGRLTARTSGFAYLAGWSVVSDGGRYLIAAPGYAGVSEHRGTVYWFDPAEQVFADGMDDNSAEACVVP